MLMCPTPVIGIEATTEQIDAPCAIDCHQGTDCCFPIPKVPPADIVGDKGGPQPSLDTSIHPALIAGVVVLHC